LHSILRFAALPRRSGYCAALRGRCLRYVALPRYACCVARAFVADPPFVATLHFVRLVTVTLWIQLIAHRVDPLDTLLVRCTFFTVTYALPHLRLHVRYVSLRSGCLCRSHRFCLLQITVPFVVLPRLPLLRCYRTCRYLPHVPLVEFCRCGAIPHLYCCAITLPFFTCVTLIAFCRYTPLFDRSLPRLRSYLPHTTVTCLLVDRLRCHALPTVLYVRFAVTPVAVAIPTRCCTVLISCTNRFDCRYVAFPALRCSRTACSHTPFRVYTLLGD